MGQDPKSDFKKMVTALGLNVSNVSLAAAFDAAVQFVPFDLLAPRAAS